MEKIFETDDIKIERKDQLELGLSFKYEYDCWIVTGEEKNIDEWSKKYKVKEVSKMHHYNRKKHHEINNMNSCCFEVPLQLEKEISGTTF